MPIGITNWLCDYCNTRYDTKKEAEHCECSHLQIKDLTIGTVQWVKGDLEKYPSQVIIKTPDDEKGIVYKRKDICSCTNPLEITQLGGSNEAKKDENQDEVKETG